jgi:hypothetical protein
MDRHGNLGRAIMLRNRVLAAGIAGLAAGLVPTIEVYPQDSVTALTCTNPANGMSWQVLIDYRKPTVDSYPAEITRSGISWFDPKDGSNYTFDRKSGDLTANVASSTGGYFRHARCTPEQSR